jgi:uncharacterized caspase-like protein
MSSYIDGYALIIGVGSDLPTTTRDARAVAKLLKDPLRCALPENQVWEIIEEDAHRANLLRKLDELAKISTPESSIIIYFSGHGKRITDKHSSNTYYIMPYGYSLDNLSETCISGEEFTEKLKNIVCRKLLILLDCCYAGGFQLKDAENKMEPHPLPFDFKEVLSSGNGRIIISSSSANEVSLAGMPYSQFTKALLEGLSGHSGAENDGYVRVLDIAMYLSHRVVTYTNDKQHPMMRAFNLSDNFAIAYYANGAKEPLPTGRPHLTF